MYQQKSLGRKTVHEVDPTKLTELILTDEDREEFNRGIRLFNEAKFWYAHEAWEQVWRRHPEDSRLFIQALIQMAAGFHLLIEKRRYSGARSNFDKALARLKFFEPTFLSLPVSDYIRAIERAKEEIQKLEKSSEAEYDHTIVPVIACLRDK